MAHKNKTNYSSYTARRKNEQKSSLLGEVQGKVQNDRGLRKKTSSVSSTKLKGLHKGLLKGSHKKPEKIYSPNEANDRIYDIFYNHDFKNYPHKKRMILAQFYKLLMENQKHDNFTRLLTLKDVAIKHFIDSLIVAKLTDLEFPLMDLGSGAGFPGIPLKISYPEEKIVLAEGVKKRVLFLKKVRQALGLENLDIIGRNINKAFTYPVQGVITRAVEDMTNTLNNVNHCLNSGGKIFFMKGPEVGPEIEVFKNSRWTEHYKIIEDHSYLLPNTPHKRRLLVLQKMD